MPQTHDPTHRQPRLPLLHIGLALGVWLMCAAMANAQLVAQGRQWLAGTEVEQRMGTAMVFCDFDGDGDEELAVGIPNADIVTLSSTLANAGMVRIFTSDGSGTAIDAAISPITQRNVLFGKNSPGDRFGAALAAADFNLDGACDLAVGIPGAEVAGFAGAGRVAVIPGTLGVGLVPELGIWFDQLNLTGAPEEGDNFGSVLAAGPVGNNPFPDLVVGVPDDRVGPFENAGAVNLITSRNGGGLGTAFDAYLHQDVTDMFGIAGPDDRFGSSLAIGDVTGDGVPDLVVGSPGDRVGLVLAAGAVQVIAGGESGVEISVETQQFLTQEVEDVLGDAAEGDAFGAAVTLGDFNGGGQLDLAVGIPGESQFGPEQSGAVQVFYGTVSGGLSVGTEQILFESLISPEVAPIDRFGTTLNSDDFDNDGRDELLVGFRLDNVFGIVNAGNVAVLSGAPPGLQVAGAQLWNGFSLHFGLEPGDNFGSELAVGRLGGDRFGSKLAIGVPGRENDAMQARAGGVLLLRSQVPIFADSFEDGTLTQWATNTP